MGDVEEERGQCRTVCRHRVGVEVAGDDLLQPSSLLGNRLMHAPSQFLFDGLQLCPHAVPPGLPFDLEFAPASFAADKGEAQEGEGLRFSEPAPLAVCRRQASKLDQPGLLRMSDSANSCKPLTHLVEEAPGVTLMLEADNEVVGVAHDDHVARSLTPSPALSPEVEDVVQVEVGQKR